MSDIIVKLSIVMFTLAVGGCFVLWPEAVGQRFDRWRGRDVLSTENRGMNIGKVAEVLWFRQIGMLLIALTCYEIYHWIRPE